MAKRGLAALYQALNSPPTPHLDDETLAQIVEAELAGENVDMLYSDQVEHIESCETCAAAYSELLVIMQEIVGEMAQAAEPTDHFSTFWNQLLNVTAEITNNNLRLTFPPALSQIGEPKPSYETDEKRLLTRQEIPGPPPLMLDLYLSRKTSSACCLTIQLQTEADISLAGFKIQIQYGQVKKTAETNADGTTTFEAIPISELADMEILFEG